MITEPQAPLISLDVTLEHFAAEERAALERAVNLERSAAQERGKAEAFRAAQTWLLAKLQAPQEPTP